MEATIAKRLGNKSLIAYKIIPLFPKEDMYSTYVELFFGAGGIFFKKQKSHNNILNDIDKEVYNFLVVLKHRPSDFRERLSFCIKDENLFKEFKYGDYPDEVDKAVKFAFIGLTGIYGCDRTMKACSNHTLENAVKLIDETHNYLKDCLIVSRDFRKILKVLTFQKKEREQTFIYADPPYVKTRNYYKMDKKKWALEDFDDLLKMLTEFVDYGGKYFAISEFLSDIIEQKAKEYGLFLTIIGERRVLKGEPRTEVLLTNYDPIIMHQPNKIVVAEEHFSLFN